jgi:hypothetical protein
MQVEQVEPGCAGQDSSVKGRFKQDENRLVWGEHPIPIQLPARLVTQISLALQSF